jgi:uncharacterized spore protein YtfJ
MSTAVRTQEQAVALLEKLYTVTDPDAVYGESRVAGEYTLIPASEVTVSLGVGFGGGGGSSPVKADEPGAAASENAGAGGGGGGGGMAAARPVAVIVVGPGGVRVRPVVDVTKIALAWFTMLGAMLMMFGRMRRARRQIG